MYATPQIPLAKTLRGAHPAIAATRGAASNATRRGDGRLVIRTGSPVAEMPVTRECLHNALLLLHTVLREGERRGFTVDAPIRATTHPAEARTVGTGEGNVGVTAYAHSYARTPNSRSCVASHQTWFAALFGMGRVGIEPTTLGLRVPCSTS